jgi:hypothetical protein
MNKIIYTALFLACCSLTTRGYTQETLSRGGSRAELALTYAPTYGHLTTSSNFWQQGGGVDFFVHVTRHWGAGVAVYGGESKDLAGSGVGLATVTTLFGPRYTLGYRRWSAFGEGLIGESNGFNGVYPSKEGAQTSASTFALQVGGGVNLNLSSRFAVRAVEAQWLRTGFPNATTNTQNSLRVGTGLILRF